MFLADFPVAAMNSQAHSISVRAQKIHLQWDSLELAASLNSIGANGPERASVGIADARARRTQLPAALFCKGNKAFVYEPEKRDTAHPQGTLRNLNFPADSQLLCAMQPDGSWAVAQLNSQLNTGIVVFSNGATVDLKMVKQLRALVAAKGRFVAFDSANQVVELTPNSAEIKAPTVKISDVQKSPFPNATEHTSFAGATWGIAQADGNGVYLTPNINTKASRLPVNPCTDTQNCGLSLADDQTWAASGSWGSYLGRADRFVRLTLPQLATDTTGVAFVHSGSAQKYLYLGATDSDRGTLPSAPGAITEAQFEAPQRSPRTVVWFKPGKTPPPPFQILFPYQIQASQGRPPQEGWVALINGEHSLTRAESAIKDATAVANATTLQGVFDTDILALEHDVALNFAPFLPPSENFEDDAPPQLRWHLDSIQHEKALARVSQAQILLAPVHVALVDSGLDTTHPALLPVLFRGRGEIESNLLDDDENGFVDDLFGYDFVRETGSPDDFFGHGTHVSGLVATPGVAVNAQITMARALDENGRSNSIDLARALAYSLQKGAEVINCSWGGGPVTQVLRDAFAALYRSGVFVVSSAGNSGLNTDNSPEVPKLFEGVVSVGAHDLQGRRARFSNFGQKSVALFAPGKDIYSTLRNSKFGLQSGTSMAAPLVSGAAAHLMGILKTRQPALSLAQRSALTRKLLCDSAQKSALASQSQCGVLNLDKATELALALAPAP